MNLVELPNEHLEKRARWLVETWLKEAKDLRALARKCEHQADKLEYCASELDCRIEKPKP